jgi:hypothetical protein
MTVQCVTCKSFSLKNKQGGTSPMAVHGFGYCEHEAGYTYTSARYQRKCTKHKEAAPATVEARIEFLTKGK